MGNTPISTVATAGGAMGTAGDRLTFPSSGVIVNPGEDCRKVQA